MSAAHGLGPHVKHTQRNPCPICDVGGWCVTFADGWTLCQRVEGDRPTRTGGWLHWTAGGPPPGDDWRDRIAPRLSPLPAPPGSGRLDADELHAVYARLAELLPLSPAHRANLRARGMADARIDDRGYATLPGPGRAAVGRRLVEEFGERIAGRVPGLYASRKGATGEAYPTIAGPAGMLVPIRDDAGRIVGYQIRRDEPAAGAGHRPMRYSWLSSKDREAGCGSGAPVHVARPAAPAVDPDTATAVVTEGPLKADLAADALGCVAVAVPGVSSTAGVLPALRAIGVRAAVVAYDMDAGENPHVLRARDDLAATLMAAGIGVELGTWSPAHKGIDDALAAGDEPQVAPYPLKRRAGQLEPIPAAAVPAPAPRALLTLDQARAEYARRYDAIIEDPAPRFVQMAGPTGSGKTVGLARRLGDRIRDGSWPRVAKRTGDGERPLRVVFLAQTKEQVVDFAEATGWLATIVEGRNPDTEHAWGCHRPDTIALVGEARHNPARDVCGGCKDEYQAIYGRGWLCNYLSMKRATEEAVLVAAPIGAFLNGSKEIRQFDVVVVDEAIVPALTETVTLTRPRLGDWLARMGELAAERPQIVAAGRDEAPTRYGLDDPFRRFVLALDLLFDRLPDAGGDWLPAVPALRGACPDLEGLVARLVAMEPNDSSRRYAFETPRLEGKGKLVPLRLIRDLIEAVAAELGRPEGADTRLWLTPEGLRLFMVRQHLVDILRQRAVVNLDATPDPTLRLLFPDLREVRVDVPAPTTIVQTTDTLATRSQLAGETNPLRDRVAAALDAVTRDAAAPVVFTFKGLDPNVAGGGARLAVSNPAAEYGHFDKETRGLNRFQGADVLAIVGRYSAPIHELRAQVQGLRFAASPPARGAGEGLGLLPYHWRGRDGGGLGRWTRTDPDPDVDAQVRWSETTAITQAIGRGRATLRSEAAPLRVYLFTNAPVAGLPIDRLATLAELGAPSPPRQTPPGFYDRRDELNAAAAAGSRSRVAAAIAAMVAAGRRPTFAGVASLSGVCRVTLYENATLRALVDQARSGSNGGLTAGVGSSPDNDIYVSPQDPTHPVSPYPPPRPVLDPVRPALAAADLAPDAETLRLANADLGARLAAVARTRGRKPVPKPGIPSHITQEAS